VFPPDSNLVSVARGKRPADLILKNARIVNVLNGRIELGNVAIAGEWIAGIGNYTEARFIEDLAGRFLIPGLIDGHTHLESSMLDIGQYARVVVAHGTSAVITDLHEIANVCGLEGIQYILDCVIHLPLDLFLMAPSCIPSSDLETSGANIGTEEIQQLLQLNSCLGLGEIMNYPAVINGDPVMLEKIRLAHGKIIDGHAPGLTGKELNAYISAGIMSDHESVSLPEAEEKLKCGLRIMIREGSSEKNLEDLLALVTERTFRRCCFVVDDRSCADLMRDGGIDAVVRKAIHLGLDPVMAIQLATINTAEYFGLRSTGAIAPGYVADMVVIDDLSELGIDKVYHRGRLVAERGKPLFKPERCLTRGLENSFHMKPLKAENIILPAHGDTFPVIEIVPGQLTTRRKDEPVNVVDGHIEPDIEHDILKLVVAERHKTTGNVGRGLTRGFGLKSGALASSIAHDSHNIVAVGTSDRDILEAIQAVEKMQGGLVIVQEGRIINSLALPIAGLLSPEPAEYLAIEMERLDRSVRNLGSNLIAPFAALSFLALPVIPELRLTDRGLVDVNTFKIIG
jgi:adenine deaminase